jgi:hypothetical protein
MKIVLSLVWLALAAVFVSLGWDLYRDAAQPIPPLETTDPRFEFESEGFRLEFDVEGTPLEQPFTRMRSEIDDWLEGVSEELARAHRRAALACLLGALASVGGLAATWMGPRPTAPGSSV